MATRVYSRPFISLKGLKGDASVTVPAGHVWVVRAITIYAHTILDTISAAFKDFDQDSVVFYADWSPGQRNSVYADVHMAFDSFTSFGFAIGADVLSDGADVYCGGYDLLKPTP